jgi:hypothetical protein
LRGAVAAVAATKSQPPRARGKDEHEHDNRVEGARSAGYEEGKRDGERDAGRAPAELRRLEERVAAFERESGLSLDKWGSGEVGKRVRLLEHIEFASFGSIADQAELISKLAREAETEAKAKVEAARVNAVA